MTQTNSLYHSRSHQMLYIVPYPDITPNIPSKRRNSSHLLLPAPATSPAHSPGLPRRSPPSALGAKRVGALAEVRYCVCTSSSLPKARQTVPLDVVVARNRSWLTWERRRGAGEAHLAGRRFSARSKGRRTDTCDSLNNPTSQ